MFNTNEILNKTGLFWQYPAITEKTFYEQNKDNTNYLGIPWATIIDRRRSININNIFQLIKQHTVPNKEYYTCCQHIIFHILLPLWKALNIKTVYNPHKITDINIIDGIQLKPCPLYAVNIEESHIFKNIDLLNYKRDIVYSFAGGYQSDYLTDIRIRIFNRKHPEHTIIKNTGDWHFNKLVYHSSQNNTGKLNINQDHIDKTKYYNELLLRSRYTLAPSGSGPNSIRFWEALGAGSIPILLSDTLELPEHELWDDAIIKLSETYIERIPEILQTISPEKEEKMRDNCLNIYKDFKDNYRGMDNIIPNILFTSYLCEKEDELVNAILEQWKTKNPSFTIKYFSDTDVDTFFETHEKNEAYKKLRNGVAKADFFRICYINTHGGYWFDLDIEPISISKNNTSNIALYDAGYKNISYMFIGGKPNQTLFKEVIEEVANRITNNYKTSVGFHIMYITGPRIIQDIICNKLKIENKDGCLIGENQPKLYLKDSDYEFKYQAIPINNHKIRLYHQLQHKYNKQKYSNYNYI